MMFLKPLKDVISKKKFRNIIIVSMLSALCAASANANLIVNGGFEEDPKGLALGGSNGWKYYDSDDVSGWDGSNLELWGTLGIDSYEGDYHAELNSHGQTSGVWSISQTFDTLAGQSYDLFFAYGARKGNANKSLESFSVKVDSLFYVLDDHVVDNWSTYSDSFVADDDTATLTFSSISQHKRTYGNFLDDVKISAVPESGSLALLALGFLGLVIARKK